MDWKTERLQSLSLDFTLAETAAHLNKWYDKNEVVSADLDLGAAAAVAWALRGDAVQRAASAWHMAWKPARQASGADWQPRYLIELLDDPYAAVRYIAAVALKSFSGFEGLDYNYTGGTSEYSRAKTSALSIWRRLPKPKNAAALLFSGGQIDGKKLMTLKERRDNTPVRVSE